MGENKKWHVDYSSYLEPDEGLQGIGATIVHVILALGLFCAVYTFFAKTELEPMVNSSALKTKSAVMDAPGSLGRFDEEIG